ncbi:CFI-box-CTERM domain-containing protein [Bacteroides sp.]|uniref:CFI-box-CTERM domain-containing protein n=1 Tax=Bacteroides sp. TaxID=29523 RepID=UPI0026370AF3|nr:CFI-box-CTERM domain-containing protein [Bacteroides sp.]MDD3041075.1 bacterial Ig-like domain-containing protein [Bacteroides sp.]
MMIVVILALGSATAYANTATYNAAEDNDNDVPDAYYSLNISEMSADNEGNNTNSRVLLIQDSLPWDSDSNTKLLTALTEERYISGYDVCSVSEFQNIDVSSYAVIYFANDQTTETYQNYAYIVDELEFFAKSGGAVIFGACDEGWGGNGTLSTDLPGGVQKIHSNQYNNYIADSTHPIITGELTDKKTVTTSDLYGSYCSHTSFAEDSLPDSANVIIRGSSDNLPTLVEYPLGDGYVIASGLTWEYYYIRSGGEYSDKAFDDLFVYALSIFKQNIAGSVSVNVTAIDSTNTAVPVEDALVGLYVGSAWIREAKTDADGNANVSLSGLTKAQIAKATISAKKQWTSIVPSSDDRYDLIKEFGTDSQNNAIRFIYELHSETVDSSGNWNGTAIASYVNSGNTLPIELKEPRLLPNVSVCYFCPSSLTATEKSAYYNAVKDTMTEVSKTLAQATDGHVMLNKVTINSTPQRTDFYFDNVGDAKLASMADIRIEASDIKDVNGWGLFSKPVQVHSNAYVNGFFTDDFNIAAFNFKNINSDELKILQAKNSFKRIQLSAKMAESSGTIYNTSSDYSKTVTHEIGHYILGFYDEYLNGLDIQFSKIDCNKIGKAYLGLGLMDYQYTNLEMSKLADYNYLDPAKYTANDATAEYYENKMDCQSYIAERLQSTFDARIDCLYKASYKVSSDNRTAVYSYAVPASIEAIGDARSDASLHDIVALLSLDNLISTMNQLGRVSAAVKDDMITVTVSDLNEDQYQDFALYQLDDAGNQIQIQLDNNNGILDISDGVVCELMLTATQKDDGIKYYNTIYVNRALVATNGYLYLSNDERTVGYVIPTVDADYVFTAQNASYNNGEYMAVGQATYIKSENEVPSRGELYANAAVNSDFDYTSLQWFKSIDGGDTWVALDTDINTEENGNLRGYCKVDGDGLYVMMAKHAANDPVNIEALQVAQSKEIENNVDLDITISTKAKYCIVYYSEDALDVNNLSSVPYIICIIDSSSGTCMLNLNTSDRTTADKTVYIGCIAVTENGSKSELYQTGPVTITPLDSNNDGIQDWYADKYLLWDNDNRDQDISQEDPDGDGKTNLEEFNEGSDPSVSDITEYQTGDIDGDGYVSDFDASLILLYAVSKTELTADQITRADLNSDGAVNSIDATLVHQKVHNITITDDPDSNDAIVTISNITDVQVGDTIDVPVVLSADSNACCLDLMIAYDTTALQYVVAQRMSRFDLEQINSTNDGKIYLSCAGSEKNRDGGEIAIITFKVKDAFTGSTIVTLSQTALNTFDSKNDAIPVLTSKINGVITSDSSVLQNIAITTPANKLIYNIGDPMDISGLVVTVTYSDGSTKEEIVTADSITGFDSTAAASDQVLTITIGGKTSTFIVQILADIVKIAITNPASKLIYYVGDALDITGLVVTGICNDYSTRNESITADSITGFDSTIPATDQELTITVGTYTTTYTVQILAALKSIAITSSATKLHYNIGDSLDISGLVVTGIYSDYSTKKENITADNVTGFNSTAAAKDQVLTITVGGKTATYKVQILDETDDECFIATAAFGSKFQPAVILLRHFRDEYLLTNSLGRAFVKFYYHKSPPIANYISGNDRLRGLTRVLLAPFIVVVYLIYNPFLALVLICLAGFIVRRRMTTVIRQQG